MKRRLFKTLAAVLAIAAAAAGPVRGQNASPDVTLDFTTNSWGIPTSGNNHGPESYSNGTYSITLSATTSYRLNSGYLLLGKSGSYLELPEFSSPVEKIEVVGNSAASGSVKQNIYVGGTAVSTQTTGARESNTYVINENYRAAGNIYTLKVDNAYNTQITYIKVYYVSSGGGSTPEPEPAPAVPHTVRFAEGMSDWQVQDVTASASATAPAVLQNVMAGDSLVVTAPATLPGKVKGVKAVKYVVPPTPLDNTTTAWSAGTFVVPAGGLTYSDAITVSGDVTLVLTDGTTLTLNKGISLASGATLTIQGNGTMNVNGTNESTASTVAGTGTLVLTSGTLTAKGGNGGSVGDFKHDSHGGNGGNAINGSVIVSGGTLTARGGNGGSVGDESDYCSGGNGGVAISGTLTINGGSTSVNNGSNGSIGEDCDYCSAGTGGKAVAGTVTDNR